METALGTFKAAGHEDSMLRKHHCLLHLPSHLGRWQFLPNCWPLERKHKLITKYATNMKRLASYDQSLIEECLSQDFHNMKSGHHFSTGDQLLKKHAPTKSFHQFLCTQVFQQNIPKDHLWTAATARLAAGAIISCNDFVLVRNNTPQGWQVAKVQHHFEAGQVLYSLVHACQVLEFLPAHNAALVECQPTLHLVLTSFILCAVMFAKEQANQVKIIIPWSYRMPP